LVLGKELNADLLIIDEERARTAAISADFQVIGLIGVLLLSQRLKFISKIKPFLEELRNKNFRISDKLVEKVLKLAGE
jgi:predicted nucleic acid-binding protein